MALLLLCVLSPGSALRPLGVLARSGGVHACRCCGAHALSMRTLVKMSGTDDSVGDGSTLAELRAFARARGLNIKTSGPGRNKAAILEDIRAALEA